MTSLGWGKSARDIPLEEGRTKVGCDRHPTFLFLGPGLWGIVLNLQVTIHMIDYA